MQRRFLQLLRCPICKGQLDLTSLKALSEDDVSEGILTCGCGATYPIITTIPRMLTNAYELYPEFIRTYRDKLPPAVATRSAYAGGGKSAHLLKKTQKSFGYQWTTFSEMVCDFRDNFWNYLYPATPESFQGRLGLDAGCGFGRHIYHAASHAEEMVGMDFSQAIDATYQNTKHLPNVHLVQADIYTPPFAEGLFDFVYSVGVLHHLPDPARGLRTLAPLVKKNGTFSLWVYSKDRWAINFLLESMRAITTRLPLVVIKALSFLGAVLDRYAFVLPYQILKRIPAFGEWLGDVIPPRIKNYSQYPFQVLYADWFDRLAAPVRFYYNEREVNQLMQSIGLSHIAVSPTGNYGWRACGMKAVTALDNQPSELGDAIKQLGT